MKEPLHLCTPAGFRAAGVACGLKKSGKLDLGLLVNDGPYPAAAAAFTRNAVVAAPVTLGRRHIADGRIRAVVVNSGNANACTGKQGDADALQVCRTAGKVLDVIAEDVLPGSTGIIGRKLDVVKVEAGIRQAASLLGNTAENAESFSRAILTTDLTTKTAAVRFKLGRDVVTIAGVTKGSGMIGPDMAVATGAITKTGTKPLHATMLAYLTTDAKALPSALQRVLASAVERSFNCCTVDDHVSTNDTCALLASGAGEGKLTSAQSRVSFQAALTDVCQDLARQIARDGEGATKLVTVRVTGTRTEAHARAIARVIADSPLVKCAMHGGDPNWGRIISAAGYAGVPFDQYAAVLKLQGTAVFRRGKPLQIDDKALSNAMKEASDLHVHLACGEGDAEATVWTCDLSRDYIRINADYRT
ncbi:MAG: bifunctional glutamate N-acetyltransferase/amino-acid acetyltransferase ArgJ [Phycisphaerae bacterium]